MKRHIEDTELQAVIEWANLHPVIKGLIVHIENERKCTHFQGKLRKKKGVRKGVSDLFLPYPTRNYHGLWIEAKGPKGMKGYKPAPISVEQKIWINTMIDYDFYACVCYGADEMISKIQSYIDECTSCPLTYDYKKLNSATKPRSNAHIHHSTERRIYGKIKYPS